MSYHIGSECQSPDPIIEDSEEDAIELILQKKRLKKMQGIR